MALSLGMGKQHLRFKGTQLGIELPGSPSHFKPCPLVRETWHWQDNEKTHRAKTRRKAAYTEIYEPQLYNTAPHNPSLRVQAPG